MHRERRAGRSVEPGVVAEFPFGRASGQESEEAHGSLIGRPAAFIYGRTVPGVCLVDFVATRRRM